MTTPEEQRQMTLAAWRGWSMFPQDAARAADDARMEELVARANAETERMEDEEWNLAHFHQDR